MKRKLFLPLLLVSLLFAVGCRHQAGAPVPVVDRIGHAIDVADVVLDNATSFYAQQKTACASADETCRFSAAGLEKYRDFLRRANTAFRATVLTYREWREGKATQSQVEEKLGALNLELSVVRSGCGKECE